MSTQSTEDLLLRIQQLEKSLELKSTECDEWQEKYLTTSNKIESDVQLLAQAVSSIIKGDFTTVTINVNPILETLKIELNTLTTQLNSFTSEIIRITIIDDFTFQPASIPTLSGQWTTSLNSINTFVQDTFTQYDLILAQAAAVANGDLTAKLSMTGKGVQLKLQETLNTMVDQLNYISTEITRMARECGEEGKLGGAAVVYGARGIDSKRNEKHTWNVESNFRLCKKSINIQVEKFFILQKLPNVEKFLVIELSRMLCNFQLCKLSKCAMDDFFLSFL